jgi:hypothetical protein
MNRLPVNPLIERGLEMAEQRLGMGELCKRLDSPSSSIEAWRLGHTTMPDGKFLLLVEVLMQIDPHWTNQNSPTE